MRSSLPERRQPPAGEPAELILRLVEFLRSSWLYPDNNRRVVESATAVLRIVVSRAASGGATQIRVFDDTIAVDGTHVPIQGPQHTWLKESFRGASLAGVELDDTLERESLDAFSRELKAAVTAAHAAGRSGDPGAPAVGPDDSIPGVRPIDMVFDGSHYTVPDEDEDDDGSPDDARRLRRWLTASERIQRRLQTIARSFAALTDADAARSLLETLDPIEEIVRALPAEAMRDRAHLEETIDQMLAGLHREVARVGKGDVDAAIAGTAMSIARRFFQTRVAGTGREPEPESRDGEDTAESHHGFLAELERLPDGGDELTLESHRAVVASPAVCEELTGVCMHLLRHPTRPDTVEKLAPRVRSNLFDPTPRQLEIVELHTRADGETSDGVVADGAGAAADGRPVGPDLVRFGLTRLLLERDVGKTDLLASLFPDGFVEFLDTLESPAAGADWVRTILSRTEPARLGEGVARLVAEPGAIDEPRLTKLLAAGDAVRPIAPALLGLPDVSLQRRVIAFVQGLDLPMAESAALHCVDPPSTLPVEYLGRLCQLPRGQSDPELRQMSSSLVCKFLRRTDGDLARHDSRMAAIRALGMARSREGNELLQKLASSGRLSLDGRRREQRKLAGDVLRDRP